jgi:hypothetical protein
MFTHVLYVAYMLCLGLRHVFSFVPLFWFTFTMFRHGINVVSHGLQYPAYESSLSRIHMGVEFCCFECTPVHFACMRAQRQKNSILSYIQKKNLREKCKSLYTRFFERRIITQSQFFIVNE